MIGSNMLYTPICITHPGLTNYFYGVFNLLQWKYISYKSDYVDIYFDMNKYFQ